MKIKDGHTYSLTPFEEYKFRAKFVAEDLKGKQIYNTDVYTNNTNRQEVEDLLLTAVKKEHAIDEKCSKVVNWSSKEQDEATSKFIEETFKDW